MPRMINSVRCLAVALAGTIVLGASVTKTTTSAKFQGTPVER